LCDNIDDCFVDTKPINAERFEHFARIVGFNETEMIEEDFFEGSSPMNLSAITEALEELLIIPSFTTEQARNVFNVVDQLVNATGQIEVKDDSFKSMTNK
jgi:hypothetical protein